MAIVIKTSRVIYDVKTNSVVIEYLPYDDVALEYKQPMGYSRKVDLDGSELTQATKDELIALGIANEP